MILCVYDIFDKEKQIVYQFSVVLFHQNEYLSSSFGTLDDSIIKVSIWIDYHVSDHKSNHRVLNEKFVETIVQILIKIDFLVLNDIINEMHVDIVVHLKA